MGQKVHPVGFRLGIVHQHTSIWHAEKRTYTEQLLVDLQVRAQLERDLKAAKISRIAIERRASHDVKITIHTARPGIVIGKKGADIDRLRKDLVARYFPSINLQIDIQEVRKPDLDAVLVAQNIAEQLENRVMFRRAMRKALQHTMRLGSGAEGVRLQVSGRLGGAEIARTETYREGRVPLHTLRADIDYATATAQTTYGVIGVKVWIFKREVVGEPAAASAPAGGDFDSAAATS